MIESDFETLKVAAEDKALMLRKAAEMKESSSPHHPVVLIPM